MSKKNIKNKGFVEAPEVLNMDDLGYMQDEMVDERAYRLENERNRILSSGRDAYLWEVELAYVRREQQLRKTRAEMHQDYLRKFNVENTNVEVDLAVSTQGQTKVLN